MIALLIFFALFWGGVFYFLTLRLDTKVPEGTPCRDQGFLLSAWQAQNRISVEADGKDVVLRVPTGSRSGRIIGAQQYREMAVAAGCFAERQGGVVRLVYNNLELARVEHGRWSSRFLP